MRLQQGLDLILASRCRRQCGKQIELIDRVIEEWGIVLEQTITEQTVVLSIGVNAQNGIGQQICVLLITTLQDSASEKIGIDLLGRGGLGSKIGLKIQAGLIGSGDLIDQIGLIGSLLLGSPLCFGRSDLGDLRLQGSDTLSHSLLLGCSIVQRGSDRRIGRCICGCRVSDLLRALKVLLGSLSRFQLTLQVDHAWVGGIGSSVSRNRIDDGSHDQPFGAHLIRSNAAHLPDFAPCASVRIIML